MRPDAIRLGLGARARRPELRCRAPLYLGDLRPGLRHPGADRGGGAASPSDPCQGCQPTVSTSSYSPFSDGTACATGGYLCVSDSCIQACDIAGTLYTPGQSNPANVCQLCIPASSTSDWTAAAEGSSCGTEMECLNQTCQLIICTISGVTYSTGTVNPLNRCQACYPSEDPSGWSPIGGEHACGSPGYFCIANGCNFGCFIEDAGYFDTELDPANPCQSCQAAVTSYGWNNVADGTDCDAGEICSGGSCLPLCDVGGTLYGSGELAPSNPCQVCQPGATTHAWTDLPLGTACGPTQACDGQGSCVACGVPGAPACPGGGCIAGGCADHGYCIPTATDSVDAGIVCLGGALAGCGAPGQPCCENSTCISGGCCATDLCWALGDDCAGLGTCTAGGCSSAGGSGEICISGGSVDSFWCSGPGLACAPGDLCQSCGGFDEPCCDGNRCAGGGCCDRSTGLCAFGGQCGEVGQPPCPGGECTASGTVNLGGLCEACGNFGEPCCSGSTCESGFVCQGGSCEQCGGSGQPCCPGHTCNAFGCCTAAGSCVAQGATCPGLTGAVWTCNGGACKSSTSICGTQTKLCCEPNNWCSGSGTNCVSGVCNACGAAGQPCCSGQCLTAGTVCMGNSCTACGALGEPCCPTTACQAGTVCGPTNTCISSACSGGQGACVGGSCQGGACGGLGQAPCGAGVGCTAPLTVNQGGACVRCGGQGQPCCAGTFGGWCGEPYGCDSTDTCSPCGGSGQVCCAGNLCQRGASCNGGTCP